MLGKILTLFTLLFCIAIPAKADLKIIYSTPSFGAYYNGNKYFNNKHAYNYRNRHNYARKQHRINPYLYVMHLPPTLYIRLFLSFPVR